MGLVIKTWEERVHEIMGSGDPVICWGTGEKARNTVPILIKSGIDIVCFCDNNKNKWNTVFKYLGGQGDVLSPNDCKTKYPNATYVVCTEASYYYQIAKDIENNRHFHCSYAFKVEAELLSLDSDERYVLLNNMYDSLADDRSREAFNAALNFR